MASSQRSGSAGSPPWSKGSTRYVTNIWSGGIPKSHSPRDPKGVPGGAHHPHTTRQGKQAPYLTVETSRRRGTHHGPCVPTTAGQSPRRGYVTSPSLSLFPSADSEHLPRTEAGPRAFNDSGSGPEGGHITSPHPRPPSSPSPSPQTRSTSSDGSESVPVVCSPGIGPHRGGERRWIPRLPESSSPTGRLLQRLPREPPRSRVPGRTLRNRPVDRSTTGRSEAAHHHYPSTINPTKSQRWMPHTPTIQEQHARYSWAIETRKLQRDA